jgi:CheY-like chemotaxis protein
MSGVSAPCVLLFVLKPVPWPLLIVDDDDDAREALVEILSARGYRTSGASNGKEALDLLRDTGLRPAAILLDLTMPIMSGHEFLEAAANDPALADLPVVVLTASLERPSSDSVVAFLRKPLSLPMLIKTVEGVCNRAAQPAPEPAAATPARDPDVE